jgi:DNA repair exonuclease SbcCD ATPase subunit
MVEIGEEMPVEQSYGSATLDDNAILLYSRARGTSPAVKESLAEVIRRKQEIERIVREKTEREQEINAIGQEQARIRENMSRLERTSDLYTRYVQKFSQQETRVETLREEIAQRQTQEQQARQALDTYLLQVDVR